MSHRKTIAQLEQELAELSTRAEHDAQAHTQEIGELRTSVEKAAADVERITAENRDQIETLIGERDEARDKLRLAQAVAESGEQERKRLQGAAEEAERLRNRLHLSSRHLLGLMLEEDEDLTQS